MKKNFVPQKDIDLVVDGLNKYLLHMVQTKAFNPLEMKNFMEPIFTKAGYRQTELENNLNRGGEVPNILITFSSGVGDFIHISGVLRELRRIYPEAHIILSIYDRASNLAELCPYINEIIIDSRNYDWANFLSIYQWNMGLAKKLLLRRLDMYFFLSAYPSNILMAYMGGAKKIFSFKLTADKHFIEPFGAKIYEPLIVEMPVPNPSVTDTNGFSSVMKMLDSINQYPIANREGEVWLGATDRAFARDILSTDISNGRKIYAICMGGTKMSKMWLPQNYSRLVQMIIEREPNIKFVLLGGGQIDGQSAAMFKQSLEQQFVSDHIIDLTNKATYRQSGAILELADMYIGNDTGTMHMAAALKIPVLMPHYFPVELEGHTSNLLKYFYPYHVPSVTIQPKNALPECRNSTDQYGCRVYNRPHCITQVTVDKVFEGYNVLKERIAQNNIEPLFIS